MKINYHKIKMTLRKNILLIAFIISLLGIFVYSKVMPDSPEVEMAKSLCNNARTTDGYNDCMYRELSRKYFVDKEVEREKRIREKRELNRKTSEDIAILQKMLDKIEEERQ
ncbi:MAG: hypothetical protein ACRENZ_06540 [Thermodesulfobacteriota bacterium]